ncbi:hypothetical protein WDU94_000006 [Cyamophila willieti]
MVIKEKKNGDLRICIDPKALNQEIKREHYALPTCEEIIQRLNGRSMYSVIDMKSGFWQVELDRVEVYFDDIIIAGKDEADHDRLLLEVFERARKYNVKFNEEKFQYRKSSVKFLGQIISKEGVRVDEDQVASISKMERPRNKKELLRFLGITKYLSKFIPNVSNVSSPLRELSKDKSEWIWSDCHDKSFEKLKVLICSSPVLRYYDDTKQLTIETDASKDGLGSCLLIEDQPVSFASRSLTKCEQFYAQIEKELLAICFATEKFHQFIYGKQVIVFSDHKPLMTIMKKNINDVPARLQRMLLRLFKYDLKVMYKPGSQMYISDALSRSYLKENYDPVLSDDYMVHDIMVCSLSSQLCMSEETKNDSDLRKLKVQLMNGWPNLKNEVPLEIRMYWQHRNEICMEDDLLFFNNRVIVPQKLRPLMLKEIHEGHLGIVKCKSRARDSLFWPLMNIDIQDMIERCRICVQNSKKNQKEPLIPLPMPSRAWERVATDLFTVDGQDYLVLVDSYSMWIEMFATRKKSAQELIRLMKSTFSRYGVPDTLYSDNQPFNSEPYRLFAKEWNFNLVFSSPTYSQSNGLAEKSVAICKSLLKKSKEDNTDLNIALLNYRNTTVAGLSYSPSELFFNRKLKTKLPVNSEVLKPKLNVNYEDNWKNKTMKQEEHYNQHVKLLPELKNNDQVFMRLNEKWTPGKVISKDENPRSYQVESNGRMFRRNRVHLKPFKGNFSEERRRNSILDDDFEVQIPAEREAHHPVQHVQPESEESSHNDQSENEVVYQHYQPEIIEVPDQDSVDPNINNQVHEHNVVLDDEDYPPLPPPLPTTPPTPVHLRRSTRPRRPPVRFGDYLVWPFK